MNVTTCDKCKKMRDESNLWISEDSEWLEGSARGAGLHLNFDLCGACNQKLSTYLKNYFGVETKSSKVTSKNRALVK